MTDTRRNAAFIGSLSAVSGFGLSVLQRAGQRSVQTSRDAIVASFTPGLPSSSSPSLPSALFFRNMQTNEEMRW